MLLVVFEIDEKREHCLLRNSLASIINGFVQVNELYTLQDSCFTPWCWIIGCWPLWCGLYFEES